MAHSRRAAATASTPAFNGDGGDPSEPDDLLAVFDEAMHAQHAARTQRHEHAAAFRRLTADPDPTTRQRHHCRGNSTTVSTAADRAAAPLRADRRQCGVRPVRRDRVAVVAASAGAQIVDSRRGRVRDARGERSSDASETDRVRLPGAGVTA